LLMSDGKDLRMERLTDRKHGEFSASVRDDR
jgi:hypothetical protein